MLPKVTQQIALYARVSTHDQDPNFISITEQIDTSSPAGKALFTMISAFAEFERSLVSERVKAGLAKARQQGKRLGRPPLAEESKGAFSRVSEPVSYRQIARKTGIPFGTVSKYLADQATL